MIHLKVKSNGWKSRAEVTCGGRSKGKSVYEERLKSIKLSRAWSFYLSSSSSLLGVIKPSGYCVSQPLNIYLNLSLNSQRPTGLITCIILMHLYHPDTLDDSRRAPAEVFASDQVRSRLTYSSGLRAIGLLPKSPLSFSSATLTFLKTKLTFAQGRIPSCIQQSFHPHCHQGVLGGDTLHASTSEWSARR